MSEYIYASRGTPMQDISGEISLPREQIVRCMDCKWFTNSSHYGAYCTNFGAPLYDDYDGFCAWACRKEGGE